MKKTIFIELQYLPSVSYFSLLYSADVVVIDSAERYERQTYRNRCKILGANKVLGLSIPVRNSRKGLPYSEILIDYDQKWLDIHWRSIISAYGKAPFFEYYIDYFEKVYYNRYSNLFDLNRALFECCIKLLGFKKEIIFKSSESLEVEDYSNFKDFIHPRKEISEQVTTIRSMPYQQVFGKEFVHGLSVLDLIFCEGPNAINVLKNSQVM